MRLAAASLALTARLSGTLAATSRARLEALLALTAHLWRWQLLDLWLVETLGQWLDIELHLDGALDVAQPLAFFGADQRDGDAAGIRTGGPPDAVDILLGHIGQFVIEHMAYAGHVDTARGDIGGDQHADAALAEGVQRLFALRLALVAMDRDRIDAGMIQALDEPVTTMLGAHEDKHAVRVFAAQQTRQNLRLVFATHEHAALLHLFGGGGLRCHGNLLRIAQELLAQLGNALGHGGREEQALALVRQQFHDALERLHEPKVEHLVGFVQHQDFDHRQVEGLLIVQIEQTTRRRDENVDALGERTLLPVDRHTAESGRDIKPRAAAVIYHAVGNLLRQFTRRCEHQHAALVAPGAKLLVCQTVQRRQRECRRLAGAGLCDAENIAAFQCQRNCLRLDWRGVFIAFALEGILKRRAKREIGKFGHKVFQ